MPKDDITRAQAALLTLEQTRVEARALFFGSGLSRFCFVR